MLKFAVVIIFADWIKRACTTQIHAMSFAPLKIMKNVQKLNLLTILNSLSMSRTNTCLPVATHSLNCISGIVSPTNALLMLQILNLKKNYECTVWMYVMGYLSFGKQTLGWFTMIVNKLNRTRKIADSSRKILQYFFTIFHCIFAWQMVTDNTLIYTWTL